MIEMNAVSRSPIISDGVGRPSVARRTSSSSVIASAASNPASAPANTSGLSLQLCGLEAPGKAAVPATVRWFGRVQPLSETMDELDAAGCSGCHRLHVVQNHSRMPRDLKFLRF